MRSLRTLLFALALFAQERAIAQTTYPSPYPLSPYAVQPLSASDLLAEQVRALALNPLDVNALVRAGELALKLGDTTAAAAFFVRAGRIDPRNPRIKAGEGSLLVAAERPGEALRRFAEAEALGGDVRGFAADRGLAYDLIGEPERAQRDYRLALRGGANDETQRRYALSLGISGKREPALAQIEPLLRRSDRGAWRTRAFILAMGGDQAGAERIATSMMPGGLAQGLKPFFAILPTLPAADRAFAVHFGEVRASPERAFDRRLVPPLAALGPDPTVPTALAAVAKPVAPTREDRRAKRRRGREPVVLTVATTPPPVPLPQPPAYRPAAIARPLAPVQLASASVPLPRPSQVVTSPVATSVTTPPLRALAAQPTPTPTRVPFVIANPAVPMARPAIIPPEPPLVAAVTPGEAAPVALPVALPVSGPVLPGSSSLAPVRDDRPVVAAMPAATGSATAAAVAQVAPVPSGAAAAPVPVRSEDSILSSILADLVVPAAELDAGPVRRAATPPRVARPAASSAIAEQASVDRKLVDRKLADRKLADGQAADSKLAEKKAVDKKAADKKIADKKAADTKLAEAKRVAEAKKNDPKLTEPSRIWVQVAGGATERDLTKAWSAARGKAPAAFKGRSGWTTPLRATNRVLAGPFKSNEEAQGFVNTLGRDGVAGFVFTSTAGQKIAKLPAR